MRLGEVEAPVPPRLFGRRVSVWVPPRQQPALLAVALLVVAGIALLCVAIGSVFIPPGVTLKILLSRLLPAQIAPDWPAAFEQILIEIRLPRVALVALTGAALACSGTAYQGLFRNPLADPYLIGVASGAGLGAIGAIALRVTHPTVSLLAVPGGAFAGGLGTVAVVYLLGRVGHSAPTTTLILAGVAVGALATAMTTFIL